MKFLFYVAGLWLLSTFAQVTAIGQPAETVDSKAVLLKIAQNASQQLPISLEKMLFESHYSKSIAMNAAVIDQLCAAEGLTNLGRERAEIKWMEVYYCSSRSKIANDMVQKTGFTSDAVGHDLVRVKNPFAAAAVAAETRLSDPLAAGAVKMANWVADYAVTRAFDPAFADEKAKEFIGIAVTNAQGDIIEANLERASSYFRAEFSQSQDFFALAASNKLAFVETMQARLTDVVNQEGGHVQKLFENKNMQSAAQLTNSAVEMANKARQLVERCADIQSSFFEKALKEQENIRKGMEELQNIAEASGKINAQTVAGRALAVGILDAVTHGSLPTEDDIQRITNPFFQLPAVLNDTDKIRAGYEKIVQGQYDFAKDTSDYLKGGKELLDFAEKLGLPKNVTDIGSEAISAAEQFDNVVGSLASGNYIGAVTGVIGMFTGHLFGGGPDVGALRQKQIMEQFGIVNKKLDAIIEGEKEILKGLDSLDKKIDTLEQLVTSQHEEVMRELAVIEKQERWNTLLLEEIWKQNLNGCERFVSKMGSAADYVHLINVFNTEVAGFKCGDQLIGITLGRTDWSKIGDWNAHAWFDMRTHISQNSSQDTVLPWVQSQLAEARQVLASQYTDEPAQRLAWSAAADPAASVDSIEAKITHLHSAGTRPAPMPYGNMDWPLSPLAVMEFVTNFAAFSDYVMLADYEGEGRIGLYSPAELDSGAAFPPEKTSATRGKAKDVLHFCLAHANACIAQQNLLGGDILLPALVDSIDSKPNLAMLTNNPVLARNTLMFALRHRMLANHQTVLAYAFALESSDDAYLKAFTHRQGSPEWSFINTNKDPNTGKQLDGRRWFAQPVAGLVIPLPDADNFRAGVIELRPGVLTLANVREQVIEKLAEIDVAETLPSEDAKRLGLILMSGETR